MLSETQSLATDGKTLTTGTFHNLVLYTLLFFRALTPDFSFSGITDYAPEPPPRYVQTYKQVSAHS